MKALESMNFSYAPSMKEIPTIFSIVTQQQLRQGPAEKSNRKQSLASPTVNGLSPRRPHH